MARGWLREWIKRVDQMQPSPDRAFTRSGLQREVKLAPDEELYKEIDLLDDTRVFRHLLGLGLRPHIYNKLEQRYRVLRRQQEEGK